MHTVVALEGIPIPQVVNINDLHYSHGHTCEALLRKTAKQIGVKLEGELASCSGCSLAKRSRKTIKPYTTTRAVKRASVCRLSGGEDLHSPQWEICTR